MKREPELDGNGDVSKYHGEHGMAEKCMPAATAPAFVEGWAISMDKQILPWYQYLLTTVHLRAVPEMPPESNATLLFEGATHEIILQAISPDLKLVAHDPRTWGVLSPQNYVIQFQVPNEKCLDFHAGHVCRSLAFMACEGRILMEPSGVRGADKHFMQNIANIMPGGEGISVNCKSAREL